MLEISSEWTEKTKTNTLNLTEKKQSMWNWETKKTEVVYRSNKIKRNATLFWEVTSI